MDHDRTGGVGELAALGRALRHMTRAEFRATYDPAAVVRLRAGIGARYDDSDALTNIIIRVLGQRSVVDRVGIVTDLYDHGWQVGRWDVFHLCAGRRLTAADVAVERPLLERMMAAGADPNLRERRGDRPVMLLLRGRTPDDVLAPLLDAILRHDTFDPHAAAPDGETVWRWLHRGSRPEQRARSIAAIRDYCRRTGRPAEEPSVEP